MNITLNEAQAAYLNSKYKADPDVIPYYAVNGGVSLLNYTKEEIIKLVELQEHPAKSPQVEGEWYVGNSGAAWYDTRAGCWTCQIYPNDKEREVIINRRTKEQAEHDVVQMCAAMNFYKDIKEHGGMIQKLADADQVVWLMEAEIAALKNKVEITGETSDGHHTFNELYAFRRAYNAVLFNEWAKAGKYNCVKSWKHSDGELCFGGGWFIVQATLPTGQISNHYREEYWGDFQIPEVAKAGEYDGHTVVDVLIRLESLFSVKPN